MALAPGSTLGPYEVMALIGAGGMGEVYRARDSRLHRDVAIKVLPESFAQDQDRLRRFEQEARSVAVLNHPNILAIYDVGQHSGAPYLVTELLDGESLRSLLQQGALSDRRSLDYAVQIAQGLAAAHEKGIVHRDLKPENLFVTKSGRVKILDFGLAKLAPSEAVAGAGSGDVATLTRVATSPGIAVGTPAYMSPEQLRGLPVDGRSDIFSFGLVLCELFSGRHPFQRPTSVETMNAILTADPFVGERADGYLPQGVQLIASHCLEKDPHHRFQSAHDLAFNLSALSGSSRSVAAPSSARSRWWPRLRLATEALLIVSLAAALFLTRRPDVHPASQINAAILPPPGEGFWADITQPAAISPDGKFLAIVSMQNGERQLWLRRMDSPNAQLISGTAGAANPFWSPDSKFVGFFTANRLKKVDPSGGIVSEVCPVESFALGGAWSSHGVIVFGVLGYALRQVADTGGVPEAIPGMALSSNTLGQFWPVFLPDGQRFLYLDWAYPGSPGGDNAIWAASLEGGTPKRLPLKPSNVMYSAGYLLYSRDADLFAQKFDLDRLELTGTALPLARHIQYDSFLQDAAVTVSETGVLVYAPSGTGVNSELRWMDRTGQSLGALDEPRQFLTQRISPDAARVAVDVKETIDQDRVWVYDVRRGSRIPVSSTAYSAYGPVWSADGKWIAFRSLAGKSSAIRIRASDGAGEERQVGRASNDAILQVTDWSRDGRYLIVDSWRAWARGAPETIQVWPLAGDSNPLFTLEDANQGRLSPDGRWLAFYGGSDDQLYVTSFPNRDARVAIAAGGSDPRWRADGHELYYVGRDRMLIAAQVRAVDHEFKILSSHPLFRLPLPDNVGFYDATGDGQRFLVNVRNPLQQSAPLMVITDWRARLREPNGGTP